MSGTIRVTLDDYVILQDDPIGWQEAKVQIKRNKEFGGLFLTYAGEYTFWGDGYEYIYQQIKALGYCFSIKFKLEQKCGTAYGYQKAFEGFINIGNAEIDNETRTVKANIEQDDVYAAFLSNTGNEYNLFTTSVSFPNGNTVSISPQFPQYHFVENGVHSNNRTNNVFEAFSVFDMLNYLVRLNTQGKIGVVSDFFTTANAQTNKWDITLTGTTMAAGTLSVTYVNQFDQIKTVTQAFDTSESNTLSLLAKKLIEETSDPIDVDELNTKGFLRNFFTHVSFASYDLSSRKITLESWLPYTITDVSITGGTVGTVISTIETQGYQPGGANLFLTTTMDEVRASGIVVDPANNKPLSFDYLFTELDKEFYLGMKLEGTPGNYMLRIEPMDYFFSQTSIMRLEGIMNVRTVFNSQFNYNSILVGGEGEYVTHNYALDDDYVIKSSAGDSFVEFTGTGNGTVYIGTYIAFDDLGLKVYRVMNILPPIFPSTNDRFELNGTVVSTLGFRNFYQCRFDVRQKNPSLLNSQDVVIIGECIGEQLSLKNTFTTDIEFHGDQVSRDAGYKQMNGSASARVDQWSFLVMDETDNNETTKVYKTMLINDGVTYTRYLFNGHLSNHNKIRNNFSRIKNDCQYTAKDKTEAAGETLIYRNDSEFVPKRIHEFEYFISFNEILSLLALPDVMIEIDPQGNGNYVSCWIDEVEMDINTKKARFKLYEN